MRKATTKVIAKLIRRFIPNSIVQRTMYTFILLNNYQKVKTLKYKGGITNEKNIVNFLYHYVYRYIPFNCL